MPASGRSVHSVPQSAPKPRRCLICGADVPGRYEVHMENMHPYDYDFRNPKGG